MTDITDRLTFDVFIYQIDIVDEKSNWSDVEGGLNLGIATFEILSEPSLRNLSTFERTNTIFVPEMDTNPFQTTYGELRKAVVHLSTP